MKNNLLRKLLWVLFGTAFLAGCASTFKHDNLMINELVIQNQTQDTLENIRIHVDKTKAFAECSHIYANGEYATTFKIKRYQGNPIAINWEQAGVKRKTDEFYALMPNVILSDVPAMIQIVFRKNGAVSASLVQ